jgi:hypothetical protein
MVVRAKLEYYFGMDSHMPEIACTQIFLDPSQFFFQLKDPAFRMLNILFAGGAGINTRQVEIRLHFE